MNNNELAQVENNIIQFFKKSVGSATYEDFVLLGSNINKLLQSVHEQQKEIAELKEKITQ